MSSFYEYSTEGKMEKNKHFFTFDKAVRTRPRGTSGACTDQKPSGCWAAVDTSCFLRFLPLVRRAAAVLAQRS